MATKKLWDKGYSLDKEVEEFTVGNDHIIDMELVKYDCLASIAHAKMLGKIGILGKDEVAKLVKELNHIMELWSAGKFNISKGQEDMHTAIENRLTEKLGPLGKKIHTGRSRNDQILTALRLYYKDHLQSCIELSEQYINSINDFSSKYGSIELPGYTHTRKAMPSSIKLWSDAFADSMHDNVKLLEVAFVLVDRSPLGTAAGYGSPINLEREFTAEELNFATVQQNPVYAQISRGKFEATIIHALSQILFDLNKIATDIIMFSMPEFGYYELPDKFTTGSSIMPNKKNPDVLELFRAKYHVIVAHEMLVKGISANLPSGYNRDIQLTKWPVMDSFAITEQSLKVASSLFGSLKVNKANCKRGLTPDIYATQHAYWLVRKGMPFRDAYKEIAKKYGGKS